MFKVLYVGLYFGIEAFILLFTVTDQLLLIFPNVAVTVAFPIPIAVIVPFSTLTIFSSEDFQLILSIFL